MFFELFFTYREFVEFMFQAKKILTLSKIQMKFFKEVRRKVEKNSKKAEI